MRRDKGRMTFGLKALFSIAPLLLFLPPSMAREVTYKDYAEARSGWKHGFVFAISQYMTTVAQAGEEAPYPVRTAYQAMPRERDGRCSCQSGRGICHKKVGQLERSDGSDRHAGAVRIVSVGN